MSSVFRFISKEKNIFLKIKKTSPSKLKRTCKIFGFLCCFTGIFLKFYSFVFLFFTFLVIKNIRDCRKQRQTEGNDFLSVSDSVIKKRRYSCSRYLRTFRIFPSYSFCSSKKLKKRRIYYCR